MSKRSYTEVDLGEPLKYEHRIKVNDFVRLIKQKDEIRTNLIEIFPGVRVEFVIRKFDENEKKTFTVDRDQYQFYVSSVMMSDRGGRQLQKNPEDTLFCLEIERKEASEKVKLAGEVKVDMAGQIETVKLGDVEKNEYKAFTDNKITINSNSGITVTYYGQSSGYNGSKQNSIKDTGVFRCAPHLSRSEDPQDSHQPGDAIGRDQGHHGGPGDRGPDPEVRGPDLQGSQEFPLLQVSGNIVILDISSLSIIQVSCAAGHYPH